jgi:curved DNA-binding protein
MSNHYQTLGVENTASQDDIKRAYRKLASQHHPDKGGDVQRFQEIEEAYRILSDPEQRAQYDNPQPQFNGFFGQGMPPDIRDIFGDIFGGNNPFGMFGSRSNSPRNRTLNIQTTISLEEAFTGKDLIVNLRLPNGEEQIVEVKIPAGIQDGTTLRVAGMGENTHPNLPRGDLHITIGIHPHSIFLRQNDDLVRPLEISCIDAMLGKQLRVETIDKKILEIAIAPGTQHNKILSIPGYGMPNMHDNRFKGRLLLEVKITIPENLTEEQKEVLSKYFS